MRARLGVHSGRGCLTQAASLLRDGNADADLRVRKMAMDDKRSAGGINWEGRWQSRKAVSNVEQPHGTRPGRRSLASRAGTAHKQAKRREQ